MPRRGQISVREAGRRGGQATRERHGPEFYEMIGRKGGETTRERHGPKFYARIGKIGGQRVRELVARGRQAQARRARREHPPK